MGAEHLTEARAWSLRFRKGVARSYDVTRWADVRTRGQAGTTRVPARRHAGSGTMWRSGAA